MLLTYCNSEEAISEPSLMFTVGKDSATHKIWGVSDLGFSRLPLTLTEILCPVPHEHRARRSRNIGKFYVAA